MVAVDGEVALHLGVPELFVSSPALALLGLLHHAGGKGWVCGPVCWLPFISVWSIFSLDDLEQSAGPVCCPGPWVREKGLGGFCFFPVPTVRQGGSTCTKQAEFPGVGVALSAHQL